MFPIIIYAVSKLGWSSEPDYKVHIPESLTGGKAGFAALHEGMLDEMKWNISQTVFAVGGVSIQRCRADSVQN